MNRIKIVKTNASHISAIIKLVRTIWPAENWINPVFLKNTVKTGRIQYTALVDNKIVGCLLIEEQDRLRYWIYLFCVDKEFQNHGIGTKMLKIAESNIEKGSILFVDTQRKDSSGQKFYRKNGFKKVGSFKGWFEGKENAIFLAKIIK